MTRETKIGLLVGLGFIVVFAVLLSHNGTGPSPTQSLPPIAQVPSDSTSQGGAALTSPPIGNPVTPTPTSVEPADSGPQLIDPINGGQVAADTGNDLPSPRIFDSSDMVASAPPSGGGEPSGSGHEPSSPSGALVMADSPGGLTLEGTTGMRMAPPVVEPPKPEPVVESVRPTTPTVSPAPDSTSPETPTVASGNTGDAGAHASVGPSKEYVVQKGDALVNIARTAYGKSSPDVISFLVDSNKGVIKGRDSLRAGQKIVIPPLPAGMFETRTASATGSGVDLTKVDGLINGTRGTRRAPEGKPDTGAEKKAGTGTDSKTDSNTEKKADGQAPKPVGAAAPKVGRSSLPVGGPAEFIRIGAERQTDRPTPGSSSDQQPADTDSAGAKSDAKAEKTDSKTSKPADAKTDKTPKTDSKSAKPESKPKRSEKAGHRMYEIQPKDTFSSIAQRHLGSRNRWAEIKQMNKDIDPAKMKPGMKIRIPSKDSMSADGSMKRASA